MDEARAKQAEERKRIEQEDRETQEAKAFLTKVFGKEDEGSQKLRIDGTVTSFTELDRHLDYLEINYNKIKAEGSTRDHPLRIYKLTSKGYGGMEKWGTPQRRKKWAEYDDALTEEKDQEYHSADEYEVEENKGLPFDIDARQAPLLQEESSDEGQTDEKDHTYPRSKTVNDFFKSVLKLKSNQSVHKYLVEDDETREELDTLSHQQRDEAEAMLEE
jgi:hypothetical protein